jgi:hypothetical protein
LPKINYSRQLSETRLRVLSVPKYDLQITSRAFGLLTYAAVEAHIGYRLMKPSGKQAPTSLLNYSGNKAVCGAKAKMRAVTFMSVNIGIMQRQVTCATTSLGATFE